MCKDIQHPAPCQHKSRHDGGPSLSEVYGLAGGEKEGGRNAKAQRGGGERPPRGVRWHGCPAADLREGKEANAKAQRRREEGEKGLLVACGGMRILPRTCGRGRGNGEVTQRREGAERKMGGAPSCRGMGILPMTFDGRPARRTSCTPAGGDARATSKAGRLPPWVGSFPPINEGLRTTGVPPLCMAEVLPRDAGRSASGRNMKPQSSPRSQRDEPLVLFILGVVHVQPLFRVLPPPGKTPFCAARRRWLSRSTPGAYLARGRPLLSYRARHPARWSGTRSSRCP